MDPSTGYILVYTCLSRVSGFQMDHPTAARPASEGGAARAKGRGDSGWAGPVSDAALGATRHAHRAHGEGGIVEAVGREGPGEGGTNIRAGSRQHPSRFDLKFI